MNLLNKLVLRVEEHPDRLALIGGESELTFGTLLQRVSHVSQQLQRRGLEKGCRVLLLEPISPGFYVRLLGCLHAGLAVVVIDPSADSEFLNRCLRLVMPDAFIGSAKAHLVRFKLRQLRRVESMFHVNGWVPFSSKLESLEGAILPPIECLTGDEALITFTSGSTGQPKVAARSHGFLLAQHAALEKSLDYREGQVDLVTLPVFTLANLASGLCSVLADTDLGYPAKADSTAIYRQCENNMVERCAASPAFFQKLLADGKFPNLKSIYTGGAPVFPSLLDRLVAQSETMDVIAVYGSTEAEPIAHQDWRLVSRKDREGMAKGQGLLAGKPVDEIEVRIIRFIDGSFSQPADDEFGNAILDSNQIGELIVSGRHVLKGYLNGHGDEGNKIRCGGKIWHRTGDAALLDDRGRIWLQGRCSAAVERLDGGLIYPMMAECIAMEYEAVVRCALYQDAGNPVLLVEGDLSVEDRSSLSVRLQKIDVQRIIDVEEIPVDRRHNAKIDYGKLDETFQC